MLNKEFGNGYFFTELLYPILCLYCMSLLTPPLGRKITVYVIDAIVGIFLE